MTSLSLLAGMTVGKQMREQMTIVVTGRKRVERKVSDIIWLINVSTSCYFRFHSTQFAMI